MKAQTHAPSRTSWLHRKRQGDYSHGLPLRTAQELLSDVEGADKVLERIDLDEDRFISANELQRVSDDPKKAMLLPRETEILDEVSQVIRPWQARKAIGSTNDRELRAAIERFVDRATSLKELVGRFEN